MSRRLAPSLALVAAFTAGCQDSPIVSAPDTVGHDRPQFATSVNEDVLAELRTFGQIRFLGLDDLAARGQGLMAIEEARAALAADAPDGPRLAQAMDIPCEEQPSAPCPIDYSYSSYASPVSQLGGGWRGTTLTAWSDGGTWATYVFVTGYFSAGDGCAPLTSTYASMGAGSYIGGSGQVWDYPEWNTPGDMTWAVNGTHEFGRSGYGTQVHPTASAVCG